MARCVPERHEIEARHAQFEIIGEPELRQVPEDPLANSAAHLARAFDERN